MLKAVPIRLHEDLQRPIERILHSRTRIQLRQTQQDLLQEVVLSKRAMNLLQPMQQQGEALV